MGGRLFKTPSRIKAEFQTRARLSKKKLALTIEEVATIESYMKFQHSSVMPKTIFAGVLVMTVVGSGCITKRTVSHGGRTVEEKYVVKRPVKRFLNNVEFE